MTGQGSTPVMGVLKVRQLAGVAEPMKQMTDYF